MLRNTQIYLNLEGQSAMPGRFGIYTTCPEVAKRIRSRKDTTELKNIIFPYAYNGQRFWIFGTDYYNMKSARKSFNRILRELSYRELEKNPVSKEYQSIMGVNSDAKMKAEVRNA